VQHAPTSRAEWSPSILSSRGVDPATAERDRLVSLVLLVSGSLAGVELHDRQGLDVDESIAARYGLSTR
jgi:hypothetical protein